MHLLLLSLSAVSEIKSSLPGGQLYFSTGDPYKPDVFQSINIDPLIASASNMPPPKDFTVTFNGESRVKFKYQITTIKLSK